MLSHPAGHPGYPPQMTPAPQFSRGPISGVPQAMAAPVGLAAPTATASRAIPQQSLMSHPAPLQRVQSAPLPTLQGAASVHQSLAPPSFTAAAHTAGGVQQQNPGAIQGPSSVNQSQPLQTSSTNCVQPPKSTSNSTHAPQIATKRASSTPPENKEPLSIENIRLPPDAVQERDGTTYYGIVVSPKGHGVQWRIMQRYNEFRLLHDHKLGPIVQTMENARFPRKHFTGILLNINERRQALERWLQAAVVKAEENPDLIKPLREFLAQHHFPLLKPLKELDNSEYRVLVIEPGFGRTANPRQGQMIIDAGYSMKWLDNLPNPETVGFTMAPHMDIIRKGIDCFKPHVLLAASKGGAYLINAWESGVWTGSSLLINRNPKLTTIPKDIRFVLCQGSNDETYPIKSRIDLEELMRTGTPNNTLLYYTADSGLVNGGQGKTRNGDTHNMASLLQCACLPRLVDAVLCREALEIRLMRSSLDTVLSDKRLDAEMFLGYTSEGLRRFWASVDRKGMDESKLFDVSEGSAEYDSVVTMFTSVPKIRSVYGSAQNIWARSKILKIERVENGLQEQGNARAYKESLERALQDQGLTFEPGLHTRWVFHGSDAVDSIVTNPMSGFQPLVSGSRAAAAWGMGTYFARDAAHCCDSGFCTALPDGTRKILLCLVSLGMVCLGDPNQKGILPIRQGQHRYNSSVDSLSNPEIYITQVPGAAYPAYVMTFK